MSGLPGPQQLVFIDSRVPNIQDLLNGLQPGEKAFVLNQSSDGVQQIADVLAAFNFNDLTSISLIGHGAVGQIHLGSTVLNDSDLSGHFAALAQIGVALAPDGDLQLYACDVASGATGQQFIADLSQFAGGADVAAATHAVGLTTAGETWTLDASTSSSQAPPSVPFTVEALANFQGELSAAPIIPGAASQSGAHVEDVSDFNGDGKADILWQNDDGQAGIWLMDGTFASSIIKPATSWR